MLNPPDDEPAWTIPDAEERKRVDFRNRLIDPAHLDLFMTWWAFGGMQNPPNVLELCEWPAALQHDFSFLLRRMGEIQKRES